MRPLYTLGLILSILIIVFSIIFYKKEKISVKGLAFWIVLSIIIGVFSIFQEIIDFFLELFSISIQARGLSILAIAIFIISIILYFQFISQKKIAKNISLLVQELAILKYKTDRQSKGSPELSPNENKTEKD